MIRANKAVRALRSTSLLLQSYLLALSIGSKINIKQINYLGSIMKNLIVVAATLALSTSAVAGNSSWTGQAGTVGENGCTFFNIGEGTIQRTGNVWNTTRGGSISVRSRGTANISVTSDNLLRDSDGAALTPTITATVDYTGASGTTYVIREDRKSGSRMLSHT